MEHGGGIGKQDEDVAVWQEEQEKEEEVTERECIAR